jgi:hypothetical protein
MQGLLLHMPKQPSTNKLKYSLASHGLLFISSQFQQRGNTALLLSVTLTM